VYNVEISWGLLALVEAIYQEVVEDISDGIFELMLIEQIVKVFPGLLLDWMRECLKCEGMFKMVDSFNCLLARVT